MKLRILKNGFVNKRNGVIIKERKVIKLRIVLFILKILLVISLYIAFYFAINGIKEATNLLQLCKYVSWYLVIAIHILLNFCFYNLDKDEKKEEKKEK